MTRNARRRPKPTTRGRRKSPDTVRLSPAALRGFWRTAAWIAAGVLLVVGLRQLDQHVRAHPPVLQPRLVWESLPGWLADEKYAMVRSEIVAAAKLSTETDLYAAGLTARVAERLAGSPWVATVGEVALAPTGNLHVKASFREPLAYVDVRGRAYLVGADGVRLPAECDTSFIPPEDWFVLYGASEGIPAVGEAWSGNDVAAGLKLVDLLELARARKQLPFRAWLRGVDVANYDRSEEPLDGRLRIRLLRPGAYINWGEAPGEAYPVEAQAEAKLAMLTELYTQRGRLPNARIDVRDERGIDVLPPRR